LSQDKTERQTSLTADGQDYEASLNFAQERPKADIKVDAPWVMGRMTFVTTR